MPPRSNRATSRSTSRINSAALSFRGRINRRTFCEFSNRSPRVQNGKLEKHARRPASKTQQSPILTHLPISPSRARDGVTHGPSKNSLQPEVFPHPMDTDIRRLRRCPSRQPQCWTPNCRSHDTEVGRIRLMVFSRPACRASGCGHLSARHRDRRQPARTACGNPSRFPSRAGAAIMSGTAHRPCARRRKSGVSG